MHAWSSPEKNLLFPGNHAALDCIIKIEKLQMKTCSLLILLFISAAINAQNYDEAKVPAYTLPEVLKTSQGEWIKNKSAWEKKRRPEVLKLFEDNVYGQMPKNYDSIRFAIVNDEPGAMNGKAHLKEVAITVWKINRPVIIHLTLFTPNAVKPAPAFLLINNRDKKNTDAKRDTLSEFWPAEMIVDSGYAIAAFQVNDAAPDDKINYVNGVLQLYPEQLSADNGMKAIGAWAWAASRVMDYLQTDKSVDAKRIAVVGHSRGGKAALWTGAQDQRFALVIANCSGNTGAALARRKFGETVSRINDHFPHWFANNYKTYNDNEQALPVDQHMLIALIAPRPLYTTNASKDLWADPKGSYLSIKNAEKVYALYGEKAMLPVEPPAINTAIIASILGYHNREGIHNMTIFDWNNFIRFANYHFHLNK